MGIEVLNLSKRELLNLGEQYLKIRNYDQAMIYLSRAVRQGSSQAAPRLFELGKSFYKERKYGPALHCFQALADKGHGRSSLLLGEIYEHGYGVMPNLQKAFDCYAAAYQSGVPQGAYQAGRMMTPDALRSEEIRDIAISWYKEAIAGGIYKAYAEIGKLYQDHGRNEKPGNPPKNDRTALSWFLRGAVHGDNLCRELAGDAFTRGRGTEVNVKRGLELYAQAFHDGSISVCFKLGMLYDEGKAVHKNVDLSIAWYLKAYERGDRRGKVEAGLAAYRAGRAYPAIPDGMEEKKKALSYLEQSASLGCGIAFEALADIALSQGRYKDFEENLKQGYRAGSEECRKKLICFCCGRAMKALQAMKNFQFLRTGRRETLSTEDSEKMKEAAGWYKKAAAAGDVDSSAFLGKLYLYYGDVLGVTEKDFTKAARKGSSSSDIYVDVLLWKYYAGPGPHDGEVFHKENPKKAFQLAQRLARKGHFKFYKIMSSYYEEGYGTKRSSRMAAYWADQVRN